MDIATQRDSGNCVLRYVLDRHADTQPERTFALFADDSSWTWGETRQIARRFAAGFTALGVSQGDHVLSWLPNGPHAIAVWFALNYIGAVYVPVNISYRGGVLAHVIANSGARLMVADSQLAGRLADVELADLKTLVSIGDRPVSVPALEVLPETVLSRAEGEPGELSRPVMPWDTQSIIYTSGTTGPSKGVLSSYRHAACMCEALDNVTRDDRAMVNLPLFHVGGTNAVNRMLLNGGSVAIVEAFDTRTFWDTIRRTGCTTMTLLGAMIPFLLKEPPSPRDRDHSLRQAVMVPLSEDAPEFTRRFGVDIYTVFNMTEISCPIVSEANPTVAKTCGRVRAGFHARIVDDNDVEVAVGEVGELLVRSDIPWALNHGYNRNPEATAKAWRNGWFHTGDAFRSDADGNYFFVDRKKDALRRRGENISSFEVESELLAHPQIREAAVIGVPSEFGEDEVMAIIAPVEGAQIDMEELTAFLTRRLPHFMTPRYIRQMSELPRTPTQKVEKYILREQGLTDDAWDREAAGIRLKREKLDSARLHIA
ncbi:AMP-binding protein [Camelimonas sp. ID_303_24]